MADFTVYDKKPEWMLNYLRYNGPHFSKALAAFAASLMTKKDGDKEVPIKPYTKERVENILAAHNVRLNNKNILYDHVYLANLCQADFLGSSVPDEKHLALYIKDNVDDIDGYDGMVFNRWYADICKKGIAIDWEQMV